MIKTHCDIVICGFYKYKTTKRMSRLHTKDIFSIKEGLFSSETTLNLLFEGKINFHVWNKLYARKLFDNIRFKEGYVYEDRLLMPFIIGEVRYIMTIPSLLICYRKRSNSISQTNSYKNVHDRLYAEKKEKDFITEYTPSVFSYNQKDKYLEIALIRIIHYYLDFSYDWFRKNKIADKIQSQYKIEIKKRAQSISKYSLKNKSYIFII